MDALCFHGSPHGVLTADTRHYELVRGTMTRPRQLHQQNNAILQPADRNGGANGGYILCR